MTKSQQIRTVLVPRYAQEELLRWDIPELEEDINPLTLRTGVFNASCLNTAWLRIKEDMLREGLISEGHTLYFPAHGGGNMYPSAYLQPPVW